MPTVSSSGRRDAAIAALCDQWSSGQRECTVADVAARCGRASGPCEWALRDLLRAELVARSSGLHALTVAGFARVVELSA